MYVLSKVSKTHPAKLKIGKRSYYFSVVDSTEPTKIKLGKNYKEATQKLKEFRHNSNETLTLQWLDEN